MRFQALRLVVLRMRDGDFAKVKVGAAYWLSICQNLHVKYLNLTAGTQNELVNSTLWRDLAWLIHVHA